MGEIPIPSGEAIQLALSPSAPREEVEKISRNRPKGKNENTGENGEAREGESEMEREAGITVLTSVPTPFSSIATPLGVLVSARHS